MLSPGSLDFSAHGEHWNIRVAREPDDQSVRVEDAGGGLRLPAGGRQGGLRRHAARLGEGESQLLSPF